MRFSFGFDWVGGIKSLGFKGAVLIAAALGLAGCQTTESVTDPAAPSKASVFREARDFKGLLGAVVRIDVRETTFEGGSKRFSTGVGSGVILSADGIILTNAHVVNRRAVDIWVTLANLERVPAKLVGWDHWTDLAALRLDMDWIAEKKLSFSYAKFGDSEVLYPGQTVFAVGTPHGLSRTVTKGIISNTERFYWDASGINGYETGFFNTWLQTDAAINPGNSGGPLVDESGQVIGINTRGYMGAENLGFAIPSSHAKSVVHDLIDHGKVTRSYIGIVPGSLQDLEGFYALEANQGMLINSIDPGSPAATAGLRAGDIVLSIDGITVDARFPEQIPPIQNRIANRPIDSEIALSIKRGDKPMAFKVQTELLESRVGEEWAFEKWGLTVREVSKSYARERQLESDEGVVVLGVQSAYPADKATLRRGDVIQKLDGSGLLGLDALKERYAAYEESPGSILLEISRNRQVSFLILKP